MFVTTFQFVTLLYMLLCVEYEDAVTWLNFYAWLVRVFPRPIFDILSFWMTYRASYVCFSLCLLVCLFQPYFSLHMCGPAGERQYALDGVVIFANVTPTKLLSYFPNCNFYGCNYGKGIVAFVCYVRQQFVCLLCFLFFFAVKNFNLKTQRTHCVIIL